MLKKECKLVVAVFCATLTIGSCFAQKATWQMQPVAIQSRWAKHVDPRLPLNEYPRPQLVRSEWQNLNGLWEYAITDRAATQPSVFDGKILVPYPIESALSGVRKNLLPSQLLWYKRTFKKTQGAESKRVVLHFGAVDWEATVYVNSKEVSMHTGGYTAFTCDITDELKEGENELVLKVYDPTDKGIGPHGKQVLNPQSIYYTPSSGIWQTVWLEHVPQSYIHSLRIIPNIDESNVTIVSELSTDEIDLIGFATEITIKSGGKNVQIQRGKVNEPTIIPINNTRLWSVDDPFLYDMEIKLMKNGQVLDKVESYFGMRKVDIQKDSNGVDRIFLNNKYIYNLGVLDQGFWPEGLYTAPTDEALAFDIKAAKAMGFNTIRKHIKVEPARWYYHADKIGMMVWQDFVNPNQALPVGAKEAFEEQVKETVSELFNFPCITTWVIFNEKWGQFDQQRITEWVKQIDGSRLVNGHSGELLYVNNDLRSPSPNAYVSADMTDVHSYPFPRNAPAQAGKARVLGEFGGIGVPIEGHLWNDLVTGWGYDGVVTPKTMQKQYKQMVDSLRVLEKQGLSGSIYTQPFDVESEQNGLMTYDRELVKLPVATIRNINAALWPVSNNYLKAISGFAAVVADTGKVDYSTRLTQYKSGRRDSAFLRGLTIIALSQNDTDVVRCASSQYIKQLKNPFLEANLRFIQRFTQSTHDTGFDILYKNIKKVNSILGKDEAEARITAMIEREYIVPNFPGNGSPDWGTIAEEMPDYGQLGVEILMQCKFLYSLNHKDWRLFQEITPIWFTKYGSKRKWISAALLNRAAWFVFASNNNDKEILQTALMLAKSSVEQEPDQHNIDTYANVLYKLGSVSDALKWQKKAVALAPDNANIKNNFEKMKRGEPTWK